VPPWRDGGLHIRKWRGLRDVWSGMPLLQRMAGHGGQFVEQAIGYSPSHRQLVLAFELLDRCGRRLVESAGSLDLSVAKLGERALYRKDARGRANRRPDEFGDGIVASRC